MKKPEEHPSLTSFIEAYFKNRESKWSKCFMKHVLPTRTIYAEEGYAIFEFDITKEIVDENNNLLHGFIATILDVCMAMGFWEPYNRGLYLGGVTIDMSFTFIDKAKLGETIIIKCSTIKANDNIGFFKGEIFRKSDNVLIANGKQTLSFRPKARI
uniref:Thioesterase domain-containing protein n=1 Tax=Panagrolaimus sp. JU765 TaxID=591449 RepID=A0AC34QW82_9BILA